MNRLLTILIILLAVSRVYSQDGGEAYIVTSDNGLVLREGPGTNQARITVIPAGGKVLVTGDGNDARYDASETGKVHRFTGRTRYYTDNRLTSTYVDGWPDREVWTAARIGGAWGYWVPCTYGEKNGWAFGGFLVRESVRDKVPGAALLKTIPELWIPVTRNGIVIYAEGGEGFLRFYPDGFGPAGLPVFSISYQDSAIYLIRRVDRADDGSLVVTVEGGNVTFQGEIRVYKTGAEGFSFSFDNGAVTREYRNIEAARTLPLDIFQESH